MTFEQFLALPKRDQLKNVYLNNYLSCRQEDPYFVTLYKAGDFFVEIYLKGSRIVKVRPVRSPSPQPD
jgi:hypothetical protein